MDGENVYYLGENVREKKTNRGQTLLLHVNIASFPRNRKKMFSDARNLASMTTPWAGVLRKSGLSIPGYLASIFGKRVECRFHPCPSPYVPPNTL